MIGIVDSGSTKTRWCFINAAGEVKDVLTGGLNPYTVNQDQIRDCLEKDVYPFINNTKVKYLFFYGSGCADPAKRMVLQSELESFFPHADVNIESDLKGAALALCGEKPDYIAILGTGSATAFYDGKSLLERIPSLGFVLGEEGSGARIGAHFLADYLRGEMPLSLREKFQSLCPYQLSEVIDFVYHGEYVGKFLGEMATFATGRMDDPYIRSVLHEEFNAFFRKQLIPYGEKLKSHHVHVIGSAAFYAREILKEEALACGVMLGKVVRDPMDGLLDYYRPKVKELLQQADFMEENDVL